MSRTLSVGLYGAAVLLVGGALTLSRINTNKDRFSLDDKSLLRTYTEKAMDKLPDNPITSALYYAKNKLSTDYGEEHYQFLRRATLSVLEHLGYTPCAPILDKHGTVKGRPVFIDDTHLSDMYKNSTFTIVFDDIPQGRYEPLYIIHLHFDRDHQHFGSPKINRIELIDGTKPGGFILDRDISDIETEMPEILKELSD